MTQTLLCRQDGTKEPLATNSMYHKFSLPECIIIAHEKKKYSVSTSQTATMTSENQHIFNFDPSLQVTSALFNPTPPHPLQIIWPLFPSLPFPAYTRPHRPHKLQLRSIIRSTIVSHDCRPALPKLPQNPTLNIHVYAAVPLAANRIRSLVDRWMWYVNDRVWMGMDGHASAGVESQWKLACLLNYLRACAHSSREQER